MDFCSAEVAEQLFVQPGWQNPANIELSEGVLCWFDLSNQDGKILLILNFQGVFCAGLISDL